MKKKSLKLYLFYLLALVIIIVFLYPKSAGHTGSGMMPGTFSYSEKECLCFGYKYDSTTMTDSGRDYKCVGIPYSCNCFEATHDPIEGTTRKEIVCPISK